jgi:hypothetical protein
MATTEIDAQDVLLAWLGLHGPAYKAAGPSLFGMGPRTPQWIASSPGKKWFLPDEHLSQVPEDGHSLFGSLGLGTRALNSTVPLRHEQEQLLTTPDASFVSFRERSADSRFADLGAGPSSYVRSSELPGSGETPAVEVSSVARHRRFGQTDEEPFNDSVETEVVGGAGQDRLTGNHTGSGDVPDLANAAYTAVAKKTEGAVRAVKKYFERHPHREPPKVPDGRAEPRIDMRSVSAIARIAGHPTTISRDAEALGRHAKEMQASDPTTRKLVKVHFITTTSMQRRAVDAELLRAKGLDIPADVKMIRPEEAAALWLETPKGQRYLKLAEEGRVSDAAIEDALEVLRPFGLSAALNWNMRLGAVSMKNHTSRVADIIARGGRPEEWLALSASMPGIGNAKAGYFAALMGDGRLPTMDSRIIDTVLDADRQHGLRVVRRRGAQVTSDTSDAYKDLKLDLLGHDERMRPALTNQTIWETQGHHPGQLYERLLKIIQKAQLMQPGTSVAQLPGSLAPPYLAFREVPRFFGHGEA